MSSKTATLTRFDFIAGNTAQTVAQGNGQTPPPALQEVTDAARKINKELGKPGIGDLPWWKTGLVVAGSVGVGIGGVLITQKLMSNGKPSK